MGPGRIEGDAGVIKGAKTIFWNGPVGVLEVPAFGNGPRRVAELMASSGATTVVGGGESVQAVEEAGLAEKMTHVPTRGGAGPRPPRPQPTARRPGGPRPGSAPKRAPPTPPPRPHCPRRPP